MKKQLLKLTILTLLVLSIIGASTYSANEIKVQLNGLNIDFTDSEGNVVDPQLVNNRTMVPMRKIFEVLDSTVEWEPLTQTVTAINGNKKITLQINNLEAIVEENEEVKKITLDAAPLIVEGRTLVPVRFIVESLEKQVGWDQKNQTVIIIDYNFIQEKIRENAPTFYGYITNDYLNVKSFTQTTTLNGKLEYKDSDNKKNNQTINLTGNMSTKKSDKALSIESKFNFSGTGIIYDTIKENGYEKITLDMIMDLINGKAYMKGSILDNSLAKNKYIVLNAIDPKIMENINNTTTDEAIEILVEALKLDESTLTINSFSELNRQIDIFIKLFGDNYFKVSGKSTKTYTWKLGLSDIMNVMEVDENEAVKELLSMGDVQINYEFKVKDKLPTESKAVIKINFKSPDTKEEIIATLTITEKTSNHNKPVTITIPKDKDIIDI